MDSSNAYQMFCTFDIQLRSHSFDNANRIITMIDNDLYPSFCMPTAKDYNNSYAHNTAFFFTAEHYDHPDPVIQKACRHFIHRWSYIVSSLAPLDFFANIKGLLQKKSTYNDLLYIFMPSLGNAVSLLSDDEVLHNFTLIQKFFNTVYPNKQSEIPKSIWQAIGKFAPEDFIMQILQKNMDNAFTSIAPTLIQKNPQKYTNYLFKEASSDFLNELIKNCPPSYKFDVDESLNRISKDCSQLVTAGFNSTCQLFGNIIHHYTYDFTDNQKGQITSILNSIFTFLSDEKVTPSNTNVILSTLYEGSKKNLFERDQLKKFLPKIQFKEECPQLQITFLKIAIFTMDKDGDNSVASNTLFKFQPWFGQIYIQFLEVMEENYHFLKEINPTLTQKVLWSILHPIPLEPQIAISVVKFLLKINPNEVLESKVDCNMQQLFDSYFNLHNSELNKLTLQLAKLYKYSPPVTKIDLFGKFNENSIPLLTNVDPRLIKELIEMKMLDPKSRHALLTVMQSWSRCYSDYVQPIISLLYSMCKVIGITSDVDTSLSRCGLQKVEITEDFFSHEELHKIYEEIDGPVESSSFGILLNSALETLAVIATDSANRQKVHQNHVAKGALIASHLTLFCPKGVINLLGRLAAFRARNYLKDGTETNSAAAGYKEAFRILETVNIPIKYSIDVVSYANVRYGSYDNAMKKFPKYVNEALSRSRLVAEMFKKDVKQPIQPLKTFLSFAGLKEHQEWVEVCASVIPPQDWKIRAGDGKAIESLKNLSEETKRIVQGKLDLLKNMPKPVSKICESYSNRSTEPFSLKNPLNILSGPKIHLKDTKSVKPGPFNLSSLPSQKDASSENQPQPTGENGENGEGSLFDVISFLWHSNLDLPESVKPEALEELALQNSKNVKLLIGFFSWSKKHNYKIDLQKWQNKISVKRFSPSWLFAIALFISNIHCSFHELPQNIVSVLQRCLTSFGYPALSKSSLSYGYYHLTGVKWLLVRNIISIDPSFFSDYPLIVADLTQNMDLFKQYFDELDTDDHIKVNFDSFIGLNDILFNPSPDEMLQTSLIPSNCSYDSRIYSFKEVSTIPAQRDVPKELLESIISCLQKAKKVSYNYFAFFMNIKMSNEQFSRVKDIFFKDRDSSGMMRNFLLPALFVAENGKSAYLQDEAIRFFSRKPPSLTRAFFRSLLCRFAPPVNQDLINKIESKLEPVFPGLCYAGFGKSGIKTWKDTALPISNLRFGYIDSNIGSLLLNDMKNPNKETVLIFRLLMNLPDKELAAAQPFATKGMIRDELSRHFLETATSMASNAAFAFNAVNEVCKFIGVDSAMILIANKDMLESPNFLCAIVIFDFLNRLAVKENNEKVLEFIKMIKNPENHLITDEERRKVFLNLNDNDCLSSLIHPSI